MYFGMNWTEACPKLKRRLMEEIRRSVERNLFRNIVKIKQKYAIYLHKDIRYICMTYVKLFICQKSYQVVYNVSHISLCKYEGQK